MSNKSKRYTAEFRHQMVRTGREIVELSKEFRVSIWSIREGTTEW